jgi:bacteriochlorophyll 4-vinyl reductase
MAPPEESLETPVQRSTRAAAPSRGRITPVFPLLLLQTMRDMDRPTEILEDEDLTASLPRRLGLSDVVGRQIHQFQEAVRRRRRVDAMDIESMIRLVARRPDAGEIFREAGRRVALHSWDQRASATQHMLGWLPRPVALMVALRAARRLLRQLVGDGRIRMQRRPLEVQVSPSLTARADSSGRACAALSGALEELLQRYTRRRYRVFHELCEAHGAETCEWTVRVAS